MKVIGYSIITILLILEIVFFYYNKNETFKNNKKKEDQNKKKSFVNQSFTELDIDTNSDAIKPWNKILKVNEDYNKYIINIKNFNENKYMQWKELLENLDYNYISKKLSYTSKYEGEALAIINLLISHMNNDIEFEEIFDNNLLEKSIKKAMSNKLVCKKLKELIESSNVELENIDDFDYDVDTFDINDKANMLNTFNKNLFEEKPLQMFNNNIQPYIGKEFSLL